MRSALKMSAMAPRLHTQLQNVLSQQTVAQNPAQACAVAVTEEKTAHVHAPVITLLIQPDVILLPSLAIQECLMRALQHQARGQERLIWEAETALACQSVRTYRQWYSHWRHRGVRANDLLDMTWVWRQRTTDN